MSISIQNPPAGGSSDIAHLSNIISLISGRSLVPPTPATPTRNNPETPILTPAKPTPSKLRRFLQHAEQNLGIPNASIYEPVLQNKAFGPDILHLVADSALTELGILPGDAIRLKAGSVTWWNSSDAKRKRQEEKEESDANKKVRYERRYGDGGAWTFCGPPLVPGDQVLPNGDSFYFYSPTHKAMLPVPRGFTVISEDDINPVGL